MANRNKELATNDVFNVVAIAPSGATKIVAKGVGAFKAARLAKEVQARGFKVEIVAVSLTD